LVEDAVIVKVDVLNVASFHLSVIFVPTIAAFPVPTLLTNPVIFHDAVAEFVALYTLAFKLKCLAEEGGIDIVHSVVLDEDNMVVVVTVCVEIVLESISNNNVAPPAMLLPIFKVGVMIAP
jgi:hypothetical protein